EQDLFQTGFDARWEIDLFGGVRRSIEAASADLAASQEGLRDTLVSVLAEVVRNYVEVRGLQRRLAIAQENIKAQQDTLAITRARFDAGLTNELDVTQAASQLATTQAQIPSLETSLKQGIHRLGVLIGQAPGALLAELSTAAPIPTAPPEVLVGLPAELLRRRPDAVAANQQAVALANELYRAGLGTFLNVLDSERALFASQSDLAQSEATISTDMVALYKALGGGWETLAPTPEGQNTQAVAYKKASGGNL